MNKPMRWLGALLTVVLLGCSNSSSSSDNPEAGAAASVSNACQVVDNTTFRSVSEHECGLGVNGVTSCLWSLVFTENGSTRRVAWQYSDYGQTLQYQCSGLTITATPVGGGTPSYTATYDPTTQILTWDGIDYAKSTN